MGYCEHRKPRQPSSAYRSLCAIIPVALLSLSADAASTRVSVRTQGAKTRPETH